MQKIPITLSGHSKGRARREEQSTGCESKGIHQELNEERGQGFGDFAVDLEGERLPKKQWRKEGDVGSGILEKLGKRGSSQETLTVWKLMTKRENKRSRGECWPEEGAGDADGC